MLSDIGGIAAVEITDSKVGLGAEPSGRPPRARTIPTGNCALWNVILLFSVCPLTIADGSRRTDKYRLQYTLEVHSYDTDVQQRIE